MILGGAIEQRITLPNPTSLAGENTIFLRAQSGSLARGTRFVLTEQIMQFGGAPSPFAEIAEGDLTATSDSFGDITYATMRPGGDFGLRAGISPDANGQPRLAAWHGCFGYHDEKLLFRGRSSVPWPRLVRVRSALDCRIDPISGV